MQTGEETAAAEEPILEEGSGREQVREGRSARLFGLISVFLFLSVFGTNAVRGLGFGDSSASKNNILFSFSLCGKTEALFGAGGSHVFSPLFNAWCQSKGTKTAALI